jgi:TrmH family RNA methyltransferase
MTDAITSKSNPRIKELRKLHDRKHRERTGCFIAEGEDMLAAALGHGVDPHAVYYDVESEAALARLLGSLSPEVETVAASHEALTAAGSLGSGSRVIGVWRSAALEHPMSVVGHSPGIYLHDVADPGNLGTVLRAAQAFGAGAVALSPLTADRFGPKAVRASMGAIFGQPAVRATFDDARAALPSGGRAIALVPGSGKALREVEMAGPVLFALGAERAGLPAELAAACDDMAHVPVAAGGPESLNVAMTATLCLYEYRARQLESPVHRLSATDA